MSDEKGHILVVDDYRTSRLKLALGLKQQGHTTVQAESGQQALDMLRAESFDLVLLDIIMPEMDGYEVLRQMKSDSALRDVPVIVISAQDELESVVRGIELGAEDYLHKSFDPVLLKARIEACLEKKRLRDQEQTFLHELKLEREKSERLLLNILPGLVAERLKQTQDIIADSFEDVSVMFVDIVDFTPLSTSMPPAELIRMLNAVFSSFDALVDRYELEKIKTSGDAYIVVGGLPLSRNDHLEAIACMALDVLASASQFSRSDGEPFQLRVGIHTGPVVAGVIGTKKFSYDLWGDTVNIASRMESQGLPGAIQVTQDVYERLRDRYLFLPRGEISVKSKGTMQTYLLTSRIKPA
ncbi:MAG: adenylate/guanylate cyclase domain-containing protein [Anaerolineales bacterium]